MDFSSTVTHKIRRDRELLALLKAAEPKTQIERAVLLTLDKPEAPKGSISTDELIALNARMRELAAKAEKSFAGIAGLKVYNLMEAIGYAAVGGTAEAVVKALELDCVKNGIIGDKPIGRGASVG